MCTGSFPRGRDGRGVGLNPPTPISAEVLERVELYLYSPFVAYKRDENLPTTPYFSTGDTVHLSNSLS
jgi:hypothetical protein